MPGGSVVRSALRRPPPAAPDKGGLRIALVVEVGQVGVQATGARGQSLRGSLVSLARLARAERSAPSAARGSASAARRQPGAFLCGEPSRERGFHALRPFYASEQLEADESLVSLARWLGHSGPGFTRRPAVLVGLDEQPGPRSKATGREPGAGFPSPRHCYLL